MDGRPRQIPFDFAELKRVSGLEKLDEAFEAMARLDHPDAEAVLVMISKHATDKTTAKAARRAVQGLHPLSRPLRRLTAEG